MMSPTWDHPAHVGCYLRLFQQEVGDICVLCYYHTLQWSVVTILHPRRIDLTVCHACGHALHARCLFTPGVVQRLYDVLIRRLQFDTQLGRMRREVEDYVPGEGVVH